MSRQPRQAEIATSTGASADEGKRTRILEAAMKVFLAYGFSRATMDDIAQAAEMSRPALYLLFKNKADIYRALAAKLVQESFEKARLALEAEGSLGERIFAAIDACMISVFSEIAASPHGADILDAKSNLAADLLLSWKRDLAGIMRDAIEQEVRRSGVDLSARDLSAEMLAQFLLDGIEGMKSRLTAPEQQRKALRGLVRIVEAALQG
ncbi:TetR/AcrR family transcriptional regulator [Kumtagia ephedrae]|jgi:AcrR family transcriptional regulator|uniref:TetR/AcrR family transcriptional regulator n=1 Tax=Kumtagia ephedrae TaxID=2116701 RepID=A0A2P7RQV0_9HYPH|nr:TetR/AcrR family transcriptional regulator [Mesorhizobium ephedrae]PSJ52592.1 TetR/AcrR family transcriptional regulator [Mesorhizobium ephedrae]